MYPIQHTTQRGLNLVYSAEELRMEVHVDSAKRDEPGNDRALELTKNEDSMF